jgi:DNA repair photolyase
MCSTGLVRWTNQSAGVDSPGALPGLGRLDGLIRSVTTPEFAGVTFHEVVCKSALNRVPGQSAMPFGWTINAYRGCTHACVYCFARGTHAWLELDTGRGFDSEIVVKTNVAAVLGRELTRRSWTREPVAMGTNTDPYQRAEGRYALMPGILSALGRSGTPFSLLTKGTLLRRDLPLLSALSADVPIGLGVSVAIADQELHALLEPGTPSPRARLDLVRAISAAGLACGVMVAPVLPWLTDDSATLDALLADVAAAGAAGATVLPLHLRPGAREWFLLWLGRHHPELVSRYRRLYADGAYVPRWYADRLSTRVRPLLERHGLARTAFRTAEGDFPAGSLPDLTRVVAPGPVAEPTLF